MVLKIFLTLFGLVSTSYAMISYENYKVYNVVPNSEEQVQILTDLRKQGYEFWTDIVLVGNDARIMVSPDENQDFLKYCESVGLNTELKISNVQELIDAQLVPANNVERSSSLGSFNWDRYHDLDEIHAWLDELQDMYPDIVTTVNIGTSNEGRNLKAVIIDFKAGQRSGKPLVGMIEGGIHAREWISPATVTWIIKEFLTSTDADVRLMAEAFVWHILPVTNPDGYVYTFTDNRMWRKNRNPAYFINCTSNDDLSNGIDLNRNFDFLWMTIGASSHACDQTFAGPVAASEPEAQALSSYVLKLKEEGNMIYYFAFHSYSQMILIPYSHVSGYEVLEAENYPDLYEIAIRGADKLTSRNGIPYTVGTSAEILYAVSGSSFDWVKGVAEVPIVYLFELRDVGEYGFLLPAEQIIPNNEEIMDCLIEMDRVTKALGYYSYSGTNNVIYSLAVVAFGLVFLILFN